MRGVATAAGVQALASFAERDLLALGRELHRDAATSQEPRALDAWATRIVTAAAEVILPRGETPGATDARVTAFIDHMMAGWYTPEERGRFLAGLTDLDTRSRAAHGKLFADCDGADQAALLTALDGEVAVLRTTDAATANQHWFALLKYLTIWGYCTSDAGAQALGLFQLPMRYDSCAPYAPAARS